MTNAEMAQGHFRQARLILEEAEGLQRRGAWHLVVRRCQEAVELALKAVLRSAGVEVPHVHDVGIFVLEHADKLPASVTPHLGRLVSISRRLGLERETSFYGHEQTGTPPERLYAAVDADAAIRDARFVLDLCNQVLAGAP